LSHAEELAGVIEFGLHRAETGLDVSQALTEGQLSECHAKILIETGERFDFVIAVVALHALMKIVAWQEVHELRKDRSSGVHWLLLVWA